MIELLREHRRLTVVTIIWALLAVAVLILEWNARPDLLVMFLCWCGGIAFTAAAYQIVHTVRLYRARRAAQTPEVPPHGS